MAQSDATLRAIAGRCRSCQIRGMEILRDIRAASSTLPCFALMGLLWAGFHAYAPQLKAQAGASDWGFALALLGSAICSLGAMLLAPRVERLAGARGLLSAGLLLIICFQSVQRIGSYEALCLALALIGAAMGLMDVLMNAHVARLEARSRRTLMALNHGVYSLIYALGALVAAGLRGAEISIVVYAQGAALCGVLLLWSARWIDLGSSLGVQAPLGNPAGRQNGCAGQGCGQRSGRERSSPSGLLVKTPWKPGRPCIWSAVCRATRHRDRWVRRRLG